MPHRLQRATLLALTLLALTTLAPAQTPTDPLTQARTLLTQNQLPAAEHELRAAIAATPAAPDPHYLLALVLLREDHPKDSLAESTAAAALRPPTAADLLVVASSYILLKAYPQAEHWLRYALTLTPADPHLLYLLGRTQYSEDHAADAAASFRQALHLLTTTEPNLREQVRAEYNLGLAEEKLSHPDLARAAYNRAIALQTGQPIQDPQPFLDLGILDLAQQQPDHALPLLEQATRLSPRNPLAFEKLGLALNLLDRPTDAVTVFETAIRLAPTAEQPHFFLGRTLRRLNRTAEADAQFRLVQQLLGTHSDTATPNIDPQP